MEIFISKSKVVRGILLGTVMTFAVLYVAVKVFYILFPPNRSVLDSSFNLQIIPMIVGVVSVIGFFWFGAMTVVLFSRLFISEPQVVITFEGIEDKRLSVGLVEWNSIEMISLEETKYAKWLNLILKSPENYYHRLPKFQLFSRKLNGQQGMNNFRIRFTDLDTPIDKAWDFIENSIVKPREEKSLALLP
jgi:hypothetical protein